MRPKKVISDAQIREIETMAGLGLTEAEIADVLDMTPRTFRKKKKESELVFSSIRRGKIKAKITIGRALFDKASKGDVPAIKWFEMTRFGMSENRKIENTLDDKQLKKMAEAFLS